MLLLVIQAEFDQIECGSGDPSEFIGMHRGIDVLPVSDHLRQCRRVSIPVARANRGTMPL